ncbi:MAG TPA: VOC family protein [Ignavibacteriales bacterium]|nr:VOC family protein [Ignavibacteriales bacterium]
MKRVTGIGGIFMKCKNPAALKEWYKERLGIGEVFEWRDKDDSNKICQTAVGFFEDNTEYFKPSAKDFMYNYRTDNLEALLEQLKKEGVQVIGEIQVYDYGKFGWIMDPEGNKIELWEPAE